MLLTVLAAAFLASAHLLAVADRPVKKTDPVKADLKNLEGEWVIVSYIQGGQDFSANYAGNMKRIISGKRWTTIVNGQATEYTFSIDPTKKPKTIDFLMAGEAAGSSPRPSIYEVDGDTLKLCQVLGGNRPTEFASGQGSQAILTIAKRQKAK
jgi:uncharacterized protein (TIGR03067 family)